MLHHLNALLHWLIETDLEQGMRTQGLKIHLICAHVLAGCIKWLPLLHECFELFLEGLTLVICLILLSKLNEIKLLLGGGHVQLD